LNVAAPFPGLGIGAVFFMEDFLSMKYGKSTGNTFRLFFCLVVFQIMLHAMPACAETAETLLFEVVHLNLGMQGYVIGKKLLPTQKDVAGLHPVKGAYAGTYKFVDNNLYVVVNKKTDRVLALYKEKKNADKIKLKAMIAELMDRFSLPTLMAHDKMIYWAFNKDGAVSEDDFNRAKKNGQVPKLGIIATVKLSSEIEITPDKKEEDSKKSPDGKVVEQAPAIGTIYYIITSDPLVQAFMAAQTQ
jgi:hypothetical protein